MEQPGSYFTTLVDAGKLLPSGGEMALSRTTFDQHANDVICHHLFIYSSL
jgi:hypothetical protein